MLTILMMLAAAQTPVLAVEKTTQTKPVWNEKMKALYSTLNELLVDVSSESRFSDKANSAKIESNAKKLSDLAHDVSQMSDPKESAKKDSMMPPDLDPTLPMISSLFDQDAKRAYTAFKTGHKDYSRNILRTVSAYCIACHTRTPNGPSFESLPSSPAFKKFSQFEKANFYSATRQYDRALKEYMVIAEDKKLAQENPFAWESAIRNAMAITVRVSKSPDETLKIVEKVLKTKEAPQFVLDYASSWKKTTLDWKNEGVRKPSTDEGYSVEAVRLVTAAKAAQKFPADHNGDIYYLRATEILHDQLKLFPDSRGYAEALLMLGLAYEAMGNMNMWTLHEMYFESCVRKAPHTETAQSCYNHFEKSIYQGYTGTAGTSVPKDELEKLAALRELANPMPNKRN